MREADDNESPSGPPGDDGEETTGRPPDRGQSVTEPTDDAATEAFERRLEGLVVWAIEREIAFDRSWTVRTTREDAYDVMVEFVYLEEDDGE